MSTTNDASLAYEAKRIEADDPGAALRARVEMRRKQKQGQVQEVPQDTPEQTQQAQDDVSLLDTAMSIAGDVGTGISNLGDNINAGAAAASQSVMELLNVPEMTRALSVGLNRALGDEERAKELEAKPLIDIRPDAQAESVTGELIRGVTQFGVSFIGPAKALKVGQGGSFAGNLAKSGAAGFIADFVGGYNPGQKNLSDLVTEHTDLLDPTLEFLTSDEDDTEAEARLKMATEGLLVGGLFDVVHSGVRAIKNAPQARKNNIAKLKEKREEIQMQRKADEEVRKEMDASPPSERVEDALGTGEKAVAKKTKKEKERSETFITDTADDSDFALNINMNRIDSEEDVKNLIKNTADEFAGDFKSAGRGTQSLEETEALADNLGMTTEQLMARRNGEPFNAEQAVAARKLLVASSEKVTQLAKRVASTDATAEDKFALMKAVTTQRAIQEQVSGLTAEAGRALSSFRIIAKSAKAQQEQIAAALEQGGKSIDDLAEALSMTDTAAGANRIIEDAFQASKGDVMEEFWINSILSSFGTHMVNIVGNGMTVFWNAGNRFITPAIGRVMGDQETTMAEALQSIYGAAQGAKDGLRLAAKALKSSEFVDEATTMERGSKKVRKAISAKSLNLTGPMGRFADYTGSVIRTPGRLLTGGDVFFQSVNRRMELRALSYRQAIDEGLEGEAAGKRMMEIMANPPEEMMKQADSFARVQTFTNNLGKTGSALQNVANSHPALKLILPFVRTPLNIMKYVGRSSPLAPISNQFKADITAGGARRDRALAQMGTGSAIMMGAVSLSGEGVISGAGPADPNVARVKRLTGWQPYSVRIGDTWYNYSRLDPIGATIGLAADMGEIMGAADEADAMQLVAASTTAVAKNVASKTYLAGVMDFFTMLERAQTDPSKDNKAVTTYFEKLAASFVPLSSLVASVEREVDPTIRATQGLLERVMSRVPGASTDLPPVLNIFGDEVFLEGGVGPDIMSPIYTSSVKSDPVIDELANIGIGITMPPDVIMGVKLSSSEYHDYVKLAGKETKINGASYKSFLNRQMKKASYKRLGPEGRKMIVNNVTQGFREKAKAEMLNRNPSLKMKVKQLQAEERQKIRAGN